MRRCTADINADVSDTVGQALSLRFTSDNKGGYSRKKQCPELTDCVATSGIIVGGILLPGHQLLRVKQLPVGPSSNLVHNSGLQVNEDSSANKILFRIVIRIQVKSRMRIRNRIKVMRILNTAYR